MEEKPSIAQRSVNSLGWTLFTSAILTVLGFGRSVLLARLLPIDVFGVYAFATSLISLTSPFATWTAGNAFLHRTPETQDEDYAAAVLFTLKLILISIWASIIIIGTILFSTGQNRTALLVLTIISGLTQLTEVPRLILIRRIVHRRLAILELLDAFLSIFVALGLAWRGVTLWALLATNVVTLVLSIIVLFIWRPVWRPRLAWSTSVIRYYFSFGSKTLIATLITQALDRLDDLWTGSFLGTTALSFYSKSYTFATYPRKIAANPINSVAGGIYAELKTDRLRLSKAFFRVNALLVRSGFLLGGVLALIAPEFIRLLLGERWLPMLSIFRLMLLFTLFDPIKATVGQLFVAVGKPEQILKARFIQLCILVAGLFSLGLWLDVSGVALAVDAMLVAGIIILLWQARMYVDFSVRRLIGIPFLALAVALLVGLLIGNCWGPNAPDLWKGVVKGAAFLIVYGAILLTGEYRHLVKLFSFAWSLLTYRAVKSDQAKGDCRSPHNE